MAPGQQPTVGRTPIWSDLVILEAFSNLFHDYGARVEPHLLPARVHSFGSARGINPNAANVPKRGQCPPAAGICHTGWDKPAKGCSGLV